MRKCGQLSRFLFCFFISVVSRLSALFSPVFHVQQHYIAMFDSLAEDASPIRKACQRFDEKTCLKTTVIIIIITSILAVLLQVIPQNTIHERHYIASQAEGTPPRNTPALSHRTRTLHTPNTPARTCSSK